MILALDTSAAISAAAVADDGTVLAAEAFDAPRSHAELLAPMVQRIVEAAGERPEAIVVGTGPAPFTGLRVGLVTAATLGHAWGVEVHGVCSLDGIGLRHADATVVTDARRHEVYWARYEGGRRVEGPAVDRPHDVPIPGGVVGAGVSLYPDAFDGEAAALAAADLVAVWRRDSAEGIADFPLEPLYLRRPDVHGAPRP